MHSARNQEKDTKDGSCRTDEKRLLNLADNPGGVAGDDDAGRDILGVSDGTILSLAVKIGNFLAEKVCPQSKEEELLKEMWDIATIDERKTIATLMFKMVK